MGRGELRKSRTWQTSGQILDPGEAVEEANSKLVVWCVCTVPGRHETIAKEAEKTGQRDKARQPQPRARFVKPAPSMESITLCFSFDGSITELFGAL